jgi:hypothetical protein
LRVALEKEKKIIRKRNPVVKIVFATKTLKVQ